MNVTIDFFGKQATDKVTGFTGIATSVSYHMYGCEQVCLMPKCDDSGKTREGQWFDIGRLDFGEQIVMPSEVQSSVPGCEFRDNGPMR
jgi:hypothetical protein